MTLFCQVARHYLRRRALWMSVAACAGVILALAQSVPDRVTLAAHQDQPQYEGADIVFLVDQSGSMGGAEFNAPTVLQGSDPDKRRFEVARSAIDFVAQLRYNYVAASNTNWDIRTSVIYFGDSIEQPLQNFTIAPNNEQEWAASKTGVEADLSLNQFGNRNLGSTNFSGAFAEAFHQFDIMAQSRSNAGSRLRAIILVTDGSPCVGDCDNNGFDPFVHINEVKQNVATSFSGSNDRLYVVALNNTTDSYWTRFGQYWKDMAGQRGFAELIPPDNTDVTPYVQRAIDDIVAPFTCNKTSQAGCITEITDEVVVRPYLSKVVFIAHKIKPEDVVTFNNGNTPVDLSKAKLSDPARLVQTIEISNPPPGIWKIVRPEGRDVKLFSYEVLQPNFQLILPPDTAALGCGRPTDVGVEFRDANGNLVAEDSNYPIQLQLEFKWPDSPQLVSDMGRPKSAGVYTQRTLLAGKGTNVPVNLHATTTDPNGKEIALFDGQIKQISTPDCRFEWGQALPSRMAQYDVISPTLTLLGGSQPLPLLVPGEYQIEAVVNQQSGGTAQPVSPARAGDDLSLVVPIRPTQCGDVTLGVQFQVRDLKSNTVQPLTTLPDRTIAIDCKRLVQMVVQPLAALQAPSQATSSGPIQTEACQLLGGHEVLRWNISFKDENNQPLRAQDFLSQSGLPPFTLGLVNEQTRQNVPASSYTPEYNTTPTGYEWRIGNLSPGRYRAQLEFTGAVQPTFIRDVSTARYDVSLTLTPPQGLTLWRGGFSFGAALLAALLIGAIYFFISWPRRGLFLQGDLSLVPEGMQSHGQLGRTTMALMPARRQTISDIEYPMLRDYAERLIVRQDSAKWDRIYVRAVADNRVGPEVEINESGMVMLDNRQPNLPSGNLSYLVRDLDEAERAARAKRRSDRRAALISITLAAILAVAAAAATWTWLPIGC
jgi:hypothetical protein